VFKVPSAAPVAATIAASRAALKTCAAQGSKGAGFVVEALQVLLPESTSTAKTPASKGNKVSSSTASKTPASTARTPASKAKTANTPSAAAKTPAAPSLAEGTPRKKASPAVTRSARKAKLMN